MMKRLHFEGIDLFCGAGGVTEGIHRARHGRRKIAKVRACVNHDPLAIESHAANHKDIHHFIEDITKQNPRDLPRLTRGRLCRTFLHASLECTNHSKAKGGMSRDADSRTLANHLFKYLRQGDYDYVTIENVEEFLIWGPLINKRDKVTGEILLDKAGRPIMVPCPKRKGTYFRRWVSRVEQMGYRGEWRVLNVADYGGRTARRRLIMIFAKGNLPIAWPEATHSKTPKAGRKKWKPVRPCLDLYDEGRSIFGRKKMLVEKTLERIYAGLVKYVANGENEYLKRYYSGKPIFISSYYSSGMNNKSVGVPCSTIPTKARQSLISCAWLGKQYSGADNHQRLKIALISERHQYLINPQWFNQNPRSLEEPCFTLIARMDKTPPYMVTTETGEPCIVIYPEDTPAMVKIKEFMAAYGIVDIKMRMLKIKELLRITGLPETYILKGNQTNQKKFIGNAVPPILMKVVYESLYQANLRYLEAQKTLEKELQIELELVA